MRTLSYLVSPNNIQLSHLINFSSRRHKQTLLSGVTAAVISDALVLKRPAMNTAQ